MSRTRRGDLSPESVACRFDRQAEAYRDSLAPVLHAAGLRLLRELQGFSRTSILDVGTGVGTLLPHLEAASPAATILGCDLSQGMLALAPSGSSVAVMDARRLAVATGRVDLVLAVFMLFFMKEPLHALREARRVLRPEGRLGTVTWGTELESPALSIWTECLDEQDPQPGPLTEVSGDEALNTAEKLEALLAQAGFASSRAWIEEFATTIDLEHLIRMKTTVGRERTRFDGLDATAQAKCIARARERLAGLDPEGFVARAQLVYAVGS